MLPHVRAVVLADTSAGMLAKAEEKLATGAYPGPYSGRGDRTTTAVSRERRAA